MRYGPIWSESVILELGNSGIPVSFGFAGFMAAEDMAILDLLSPILVKIYC